MMLIKVFERRSWTWFLALGRRTTHELLSHFMLTLHSCDKKVDSIWKWKNIDGTSKNHLDVTSQSVVFVQTVRLSTKFNFEHLNFTSGGMRGNKTPNANRRLLKITLTIGYGPIHWHDDPSFHAACYVFGTRSNCKRRAVRRTECKWAPDYKLMWDR